MFVISKNKKTFFKKLFVFFIIFCLLVGIFFLIKYYKSAKIFGNLQDVKNFIKSTGFWSYSVFAILQFLQVTLLPLPASVTTIAGVIIFGPFVAFLISTLAVILGSVFAYACGKFFGEKFLTKFVKKQKIEKNKELFKKGNFIFFIMMLFPFFPDDILCLIAGFANMDFKFFITTNLITRPIGFFCLCFLGSGKIIPFNSWGIWVWLIIFSLLLVMYLVYIKNKEKIKNFIKSKFFKKWFYNFFIKTLLLKVVFC